MCLCIATGIFLWGKPHYSLQWQHTRLGSLLAPAGRASLNSTTSRASLAFAKGLQLQIKLWLQEGEIESVLHQLLFIVCHVEMTFLRDFQYNRRRVHPLELFSLWGQGKFQAISCPDLLHSQCRDAGTPPKVITFCRWSHFGPQVLPLDYCCGIFWC